MMMIESNLLLRDLLTIKYGSKKHYILTHLIFIPFINLLH